MSLTRAFDAFCMRGYIAAEMKCCRSSINSLQCRIQGHIAFIISTWDYIYTLDRPKASANVDLFLHRLENDWKNLLSSHKSLVLADAVHKCSFNRGSKDGGTETQDFGV